MAHSGAGRTFLIEAFFSALVGSGAAEILAGTTSKPFLDGQAKYLCLSAAADVGRSRALGGIGAGQSDGRREAARRGGSAALSVLTHRQLPNFCRPRPSPRRSEAAAVVSSRAAPHPPYQGARCGDGVTFFLVT